MKPLSSSLNKPLPSDLDNDYSINWDDLIKSTLEIQSENDFGYLEEICKYSNNQGIPSGIQARRFGFQKDKEFEKLLNHVHYLRALQVKFIPYLFNKTKINEHLEEICENKEELKEQITQANFTYLNSFHIQGVLSEYLYHYGMYDHFYKNNSPNKARKITEEFIQALYSDDLENVICFQTRESWGNWFDPQSNTDRTFVIINRKEHIIWLFCFSHSD